MPRIVEIFGVPIQNVRMAFSLSHALFESVWYVYVVVANRYQDIVSLKKSYRKKFPKTLALAMGLNDAPG